MRIFCFLLLFLAGIGNSFGQVQGGADASNLITLNLQRTHFDEFILELEKKSGHTFYYDPLWTADLYISVQTTQKSLREILEATLVPNDLFFAIDKNKRVFITNSAPLLTTLPRDSAGRVGEQFIANNRLIGDYVDTARLSSITIENKVFQFGNPYSAKPGEKILTGYIKSINTGEPIIQATISVAGTSINVQPDQNGFYTIAVPNETATIHINSVGKSSTKRQVLMYENGRLDVELDDVVYALSEVVVSAERGANLRRTTMGVEKISVQTIRQAPAVLGEADVIKVVLTLPGVQSVSEASGGFNVRGGATDQNLVLFNDATVFNPSHFFGFFSGFNPDVVNNIELFKSSIPAKYGGRLASVLDITAKTGNKNKFSGAGGIGLLTGRLMFEGPIGKNTTFVVGGRSTYSDWLLDLIPDDNYKNSSAGFYDGNISINSQITEKDAIQVMGYYSKDRFSLSSDTTYNYYNQNFNIKWNRIHSGNLYSNLTLGYDGFGNGILGRGNEVYAFDWNFDMRQYVAKLDFSHRINQKHNLSYGIQSLYIQSNPGKLNPVGLSSIFLPNDLGTEQALESSIYLSDNISLNDRFGLDLGLRYTLYQFLGPNSKRTYADGLPRSPGNMLSEEQIAKGKTIQAYHAPEIRAGIRYTIDESSSLKAGYNTLNQYIHMLSNTTAITPTDTWKLSDNNIRPQTGDQVAIGYYKNFNQDKIETSVEAYYKRMDDYLDYKSGAKLMMNHAIETDVINTEAKAYGVEVMLKKNTGKLNGWISYTYARVQQRTVGQVPEEMINRGEYYASNHDKPHSVNFVGNYRLTHRFSVSVNSQYSTGRPITLPIGMYEYAGSKRVIYSDRNQYRIPDYFRMDLSLNIEGNHRVDKLAHSSWSVGVYNITGRRNPFSVFFLSERGNLNGYKMSVFGTQIPFVTYNFKF